MCCVVCGCSTGDEVEGWTALCCNDPEPGEAPNIAFYCPPCATAEFKHPPAKGLRSRRSVRSWNSPALRLTDSLCSSLPTANPRRYMDTAALLLMADASGDERVGLSIKDREAIMDVLDGVPDNLAELHSVLVVEQMSRTLDTMA